MRRVTVVVLFAAVLASGVLAAPLNKARVSSEATWVLHADYELFARTTLGLFRGKVVRLRSQFPVQSFCILAHGIPFLG